jgi:cell division protein FtsI/penicillin-binding protein 2
VVKPLIYIAGAESGKITPDETIECTSEQVPQYWPNCWIFNQYRVGHNSQWTYNNAVNAIRGSCNIYFSRLAHRLDPLYFQGLLYKFGYGRAAELVPDSMKKYGLERRFNQVTGCISSVLPRGKIESLSDVPELKKPELRFFGIGQGNFRVTPLQVANAMAALARKGLYKKPNLFITEENENNKSIYLGISPETIDIVYKGMHAVVYKSHGTANKEFQPMLDYFDSADVKIYGKTGSTQAPETAWFGGFAKDSSGKSIAIAVVVEGGQHGSEDAAPLARDIIDMCIHAGYLGEVPYDFVE